MPPGQVAALHQLLRKLRPDVLHTHQTAALLYAGTAARVDDVPVVVHTEHGKHYWANWRRRLVGRFAGRYARQFFCVSTDILREVRARRLVPPGRTSVVHNGIDVARFTSPAPAGLRDELGLPANARVVGTVGRLNEVKRQDVLIRGFARLAARHPHRPTPARRRRAAPRRT